jgi:recombination protein RecA
MGLRARLMSQALRKLTGVLSKASTSAIFINQVRQKIGISFGNPYTTPGGLALKFHASVRMDIRRISSLQQGNESIGIRVKVKIVKNKLAPPFKEAEFDIMYGKGISKEGELIDFGQSMGLVDKSGAWYSYGETSLGQGRENAKLFLKENPKTAQKLEKKIREEINIPDGQDNEDRTAEKEEKQS